MSAELKPALKEQIEALKGQFPDEWIASPWKPGSDQEAEYGGEQVREAIDRAVALTLAFSEGEKADLKVQLRNEQRATKEMAVVQATQAARIEVLERRDAKIIENLPNLIRTAFRRSGGLPRLSISPDGRDAIIKIVCAEVRAALEKTDG